MSCVDPRGSAPAPANSPLTRPSALRGSPRPRPRPWPWPWPSSASSSARSGKWWKPPAPTPSRSRPEPRRVRGGWSCRRATPGPCASPGPRCCRSSATSRRRRVDQVPAAAGVCVCVSVCVSVCVCVSVVEWACRPGWSDRSCCCSAFTHWPLVAAGLRMAAGARCSLADWVTGTPAFIHKRGGGGGGGGGGRGGWRGPFYTYAANVSVIIPLIGLTLMLPLSSVMVRVRLTLDLWANLLQETKTRLLKYKRNIPYTVI